MGLLTLFTLFNKSIIFKRSIEFFIIDNIEFNELLYLSAIRPVNSLLLRGKSLKNYPGF